MKSLKLTCPWNRAKFWFLVGWNGTKPSQKTSAFHNGASNTFQTIWNHFKFIWNHFEAVWRVIFGSIELILCFYLALELFWVHLKPILDSFKHICLTWWWRNGSMFRSLTHLSLSSSLFSWKCSIKNISRGSNGIDPYFH